jgi:CheY-like chemotaxis protein
VSINGNQEAILLVDDDIEVLKALKKVLEKDGFEVLPYSDAPSAMRFINATKKRFDLVITDVSMPGMTWKRSATVLVNTSTSHSIRANFLALCGGR